MRLETEQAWYVIEEIIAGRINKAAQALQLTTDLGINNQELLSQMKLEREALRLIRDHMTATKEQSK